MVTLCLVNMRCIFSVNEWTYGTVATALDGGGLRFNHCGYSVFSEYALYFLRE